MKSLFNSGKLLCDADSLYFRVACVTKKKNEIRYNINKSIDNIRRQCGSDEIYYAVKGKGNFRHDIYPAYKANRKELDEDLKEALNYGHNYMVDKHGARRADGMEADDVVAIWAAECRGNSDDYTVVGIDKDLLQIPGNHFNFVSNVHRHVTPAEGRYNLMVQCLTGDTSDNIKGIKGIGPKKAAKILDGIPTGRLWSRVQAAWRMHQAGSPVLSRRLLEMLTSFEELEIARDLFKSETAKRKQNVLEKRKANEEDSGVRTVPE